MTLCVLFLPSVSYAQNNKNTHFQFDIDVPLIGNPDRDDVDPYSNEKASWFLPDGIGIKIGFWNPLS